MNNQNQELNELENLKRVKYIVRRSENPHPFTIIVIIIISMFVIYYIYNKWIKTNITGNWKDKFNNTRHIEHNAWNDKLILDNVHTGMIKGNLIVLYEDACIKMGIYENSEIHWCDDDIWSK
jgi:hypothetical protein